MPSSPRPGETRSLGPAAPGEGAVPPALPDTVTNLDVDTSLAPGTLIAGRYRMISLRGLGGMGVVYRARDEELGVDVALKVLRSDLGHDTHWIDRFRRETLLARQVTHRNVVRIHDIGESDGLRFLTMSFVDGESLAEVLDRQGRLAIERAVAIVRQVADALQGAHDAGVIHRDLKPTNILVTADDIAFITDFGVARSVDQSGLTRTGAIVGTPDYLSPEQISGDAVDGRSDIYALGLLFYEMITGERLFKGETRTERLVQRLTERTHRLVERGLKAARWPAASDPSQSASGETSVSVRVPAHVRAIIHRCLERHPVHRYQHARDIVDDLDRRAVRSPRATRRRIVVALAIAALAAVIWIITAGAPDAWRRATARGRTAAASSDAGAETQPRHAVAVLPLADATTDPALAWTGSGVAEMLAASLTESADLRVVDARRVFRALDDLKLADVRPDDQVLGQLASLLNVDTVVTGTVRRAGAAVRIDLQLIARDGGVASTRHVSAQAPEVSQLFHLVDDAGDRVRRELNAATPVEGDTVRLRTTSAEATSALLEGRSRLLRADYVGAAPALERAVAADPGFVEALERLSETYQQLGYGDKALSTAERAADALGERRATRLGRRVRARLAMLRGEPAAAESEYAALCLQYPNDLELLLDLAAAQGAQGHLAEAATTLTRVTTLDAKDPRAWFQLGKNSILMGESRKAIDDYLVRAQALQNELRNLQGQGDVANGMGVAYHELGNYAQAVQQYTAAAESRRRADDDRGLATTLRNRARTYQVLGRAGDAETDLTSARAIHERIGDRQGLADVANETGLLHEGRGEYDRALVLYQDALRIRRGLGDERLLAQSYDNVGYIQYLQGEYDAARVYWKEALDLRRRIGDKGGVVLSTQNMGFLQTAQGHWDDATKLFLEALEQARGLDFKSAMAVSYGNLGVLHEYQGRLSAALESFAEARRMLEAQDEKRGLVEFTLKEAGALLDLGGLERARAALDTAGPLARDVNNREQLADYHLLLAEWHRQRGDAAEARRETAEGLRHAEASRSRTATLRARLAEASLRVADDAAGLRALRALVGEAETLGHALLRMTASEALGRALLRRQPGEAEVTARRAIAIADRAGWRAGRYRLHHLLGQALEAKRDLPAAERAYRQAALDLAALRESLPPGLQAGFDALAIVRAIDGRATTRTTTPP